MIAKKYSDIPKDAREAFEAYCEEQEIEEFKKTIESVGQIIVEFNDSYHESMDDFYINCTFHLKIGQWKFMVVGRSYRKDNTVCDEELDKFITVINMKTARKKVSLKKEIKISENEKKWSKFFKGKTKQQIFEKIKKSKFALK